jgi:hypothetical protein
MHRTELSKAQRQKASRVAADDGNYQLRVAAQYAAMQQ